MNWNYIIHISIISLSLLIATLLRARIKFFQKFLIPAPIIAGIFLLIFYNFIAPSWNLRSDFLGVLVYHLLNISFIAMMLRVSGKREDSAKGRRMLAENVTAVMAQYALQGTLGLLVTALLIATIKPDLFPAFGFTLTLGFELGPGQAYAFGSTWERMGFHGGASVGITMAAIGFLVGSFGGVLLINQGVKRGWIGKEYLKNLQKKSVRTGVFQSHRVAASRRFPALDRWRIHGYPDLPFCVSIGNLLYQLGSAYRVDDPAEHARSNGI